MGREIRRVPPNWEHPKKEVPCYKNGRFVVDERYQPMHDELFETAVEHWTKGFMEWQANPAENIPYWEWDGMPPERDYYRAYKDEEATWFQVYETVSEGTPVTPPFATREELVEYLVANGDFWDQSRGDGPWKRESATAFVMGDGWVPTAILVGGKMIESRDCAAVLGLGEEV